MNYVSFDDFVTQAVGDAELPSGKRRVPYAYQRELAERAGGLPGMLRVPTGSGKTLAAVLPWLWRLLANPETRPVTPHRLVYVLPMRALVEQTRDKVCEWLGNLGLGEQDVQVHVLMGGEPRDDDAWQLRPEVPAVLIGTQDMVLSRALMRGYGEPRTRWPVSFGLLHWDTQWVFDETQLMGPALGTSAQLQGLRDVLGTVAPTSSMWMSATLDAAGLRTPDHVCGLDAVELGPEDRSGALAVRLAATRRIRRLALPEEPREYVRELARSLVEAHRLGTRTIAVVNTVDRARAVFAELTGLGPAADVVLLHSRFRPAERGPLAARATKDALPAAGRIVVATQVLEAGVDVTSATLFTEAAPWSAFVQRCGRCNREGEVADGATVLWSPPPTGDTTPYRADDLACTRAQLELLEGQSLTAEALAGNTVGEYSPVYPLPRRRDLVQLFDTMPDLTGADIDVGPWIRDGDDRTVFVAWRPIADPLPAEDEPFPRRAELCPAPLGEVRRLVTMKNPRRMWVYDHVSDRWSRALRANVTPGVVLLADAREGDYDLRTGWSPGEKAAVPPVDAPGEDGKDALGRDDLSFRSGRAVTLTEHLADVEREVASSVTALRGRLPGLSVQMLRAVQLAGRFHDLGKCHDVFQATLRSASSEDAPPGLLAKSDGRGGRHTRRYFRHELVSALMLLHPESGLLDGAAEHDLITYLAAAHHGKVRLSVRSVVDEAAADMSGNGDAPRVMLGVHEKDETPRVELNDGSAVPSLSLSLAPFAFGDAAAGRPSWIERVLRLRDRADLGPFRLAFLEALVRGADWRASRSYLSEVPR